MLEYLYEFWQLLLGVSVLIGVISGIFSFKRLISVSQGQLLVSILFSISVMAVTASCIVGMTFTRVPKIIGNTVHEAEQELQDFDLKIGLQSGVSIDGNTRNNIVIGQDCNEDDLVLKGTVVTVYLDLKEMDKTLVTVPNVVGEQYVDAVSILDESGLECRIRALGESSLSVEQAYVVNQSIAAGSSIPEGSLVEIDLSTQKDGTPTTQEPTQPLALDTTEMVVVPDVVSMEEQEAVRVLEDRGLQAQVWWLTGTDESLERYYIIDQSISAGSSVPVGTLVELERSSRMPGEPVVVPDVIGMEQEDATRLLVDCGLQFQVWWTEENNISSECYYIIDQSIPEGATVPAGTLIRLELSISPY